jgi:hypothetical protein
MGDFVEEDAAHGGRVVRVELKKRKRFYLEKIYNFEQFFLLFVIFIYYY